MPSILVLNLVFLLTVFQRHFSYQKSFLFHLPELIPMRLFFCRKLDDVERLKLGLLVMALTVAFKFVDCSHESSFAMAEGMSSTDSGIRVLVEISFDPSWFYFLTTI